MSSSYTHACLADVWAPVSRLEWITVIKGDTHILTVSCAHRSGDLIPEVLKDILVGAAVVLFYHHTNPSHSDWRKVLSPLQTRNLILKAIEPRRTGSSEQTEIGRPSMVPMKLMLFPVPYTSKTYSERLPLRHRGSIARHKIFTDVSFSKRKNLRVVSTLVPVAKFWIDSTQYH